MFENACEPGFFLRRPALLHPSPRSYPFAPFEIVPNFGRFPALFVAFLAEPLAIEHVIRRAIGNRRLLPAKESYLRRIQRLNARVRLGLRLQIPAPHSACRGCRPHLRCPLLHLLRRDFCLGGRNGCQVARALLLHASLRDIDPLSSNNCIARPICFGSRSDRSASTCCGWRSPCRSCSICRVR